MVSTRIRSVPVCGDCGTEFWLEEWGYPAIGLVIADTISGGHDMVFLDYSECGQKVNLWYIS